MKRAMYLVVMACLVSLPLLFIGCMSDEDLYDPAKAEALLKEEYKKKFIAQYGEIAPDYSWDATSMRPRYASTRAADYKPVVGDWYQVEKGTLEWLDKTLPENRNNKSKGTKFAMTVPGNEFTIVPIYQGEAGSKWDFHMVIGTGDNAEDITVWKKSENIEVQESAGADWKAVSQRGWLESGKNTLNAASVRAKQYTFDLSDRVGELMYFYLEITENYLHYNKKREKQSSLDNMMLALNGCSKPSNIGKDDEVMIIGCEDSKYEGVLLDTDWDFNDVVFLVYGKHVPKPIEITDDKVVESSIKRYMIEDLGATDDFDFNDVVVDVAVNRTIKITTTNGVITGRKLESENQTATIRHLGGILPFTLTIGNTSLPETQGALNENPDAEYVIEGWVPEQNNISVVVKGTKNGEVHTVSFPEDGEAPMIIAVDPTVDWMEERVRITKEWFEGLKK